MNPLHNAFLAGQQQRFQRLLESSKGTTSGSTSNVSSSLSSSVGAPPRLSVQPVDPNTHDDLGRTVLHLACASLERSSLECVRLLLAHPAIQINIQDTESHWTALHRAMYAGNIEAACVSCIMS
jgi:ankyrin repeat protein